MIEEEENEIPEFTDEPEADEELYEHHRFTVDKGQEPLRIDKYLLHKIADISRNKIQNAASAESILVNGKPVKSNYKVKPGNVISIVLSTPVREYTLEAEDIPLDIVYEDDAVVVINKPAGLVVHPGSGNYTGTLVNALMYHFRHLPTFSGGEQRPGLVHRLDKNTSGLMVIAKTEYAMTHLAKQFFNHTIQRRYIALIWGDPAEESGTIVAHVGRHKRFRKKMDVYPEGELGKHAVTHYRVLERLGYVSLVECVLETGRTHQIRVHMQHLGHPVFNDETYGGDRIVKGTIFTKYKQFVENCFAIMPRHALHAKVLGFEHPVTKEKIYHESKLPPDFQQVLEKWKTYFRYAVKGTLDEEI